MEVEEYELDREKAKLTLHTKNGIVDVWGFGEDAITSFCTSQKDHTASLELRGKLKEVGLRGTKAIDENVARKITAVIKSNRL
jgi:hypothetical protein